MECKPPAALIVSQVLATRLFPNGDALGKSIYTGESTIGRAPWPKLGIAPIATTGALR
jgi:hypothetical protein